MPKNRSKTDLREPPDCYSLPKATRKLFFPVDGCVLVRVGPFIPNLGVQETDCRLQPIVLGTVCHLDVSQIIGDRSDVSEIRADLATRTQDLADTGRVIVGCARAIGCVEPWWVGGRVYYGAAGAARAGGL